MRPEPPTRPSQGPPAHAGDPIRPADAGDSVPPLSSAHAAAGAPRARKRWLRVGAGLALAALAGAAAGTAAYAVSPPQQPGSARGEPDPSWPTAPTAPSGAPAAVALVEDEEDWIPPTLEAQRRRLFARMRAEMRLDQAQMAAVEAVFAASPVLGQGNPDITRHPMARSTCRARRREAGVGEVDVAACGAPHMVPVFDPGAGQSAEDARLCVDQFEFPGLPCEYPVVHVRAREAALLCEAVGKRLCDAHEWEGACAGALWAPERAYELGRPRGEATSHHNAFRERVWSYGPRQDHGRCATGGGRTPGCPGGGYDRCGSNTYPAGAFPACRSAFGVFDLHGNVAEHMSLPTRPEELGGASGVTEMKGSWFVFGTIQAHEDDCRWRAPDWHETRVRSEASHLNYHLGFRCCRDVQAGAEGQAARADSASRSAGRSRQLSQWPQASPSSSQK